MSDLGYEASTMPTAGGEIGYSVAHGSHTAEEAAAAVDECQARAGLNELDPVYWPMQANPSNEDFAAATVRCFKESGAVPEGFTDENMTDGTLETLGVSPDVYLRCTSDPFGVLGIE